MNRTTTAALVTADDLEGQPAPRPAREATRPIVGASPRRGPRPAVTAVLALVVLVIAVGVSYVVTGMVR